MVGKKITFWSLLMLLFLAACQKPEKPFEPKYIDNAAFILQTNETDFFQKHRDYLSAGLFDKKNWALLRKINPGKHTTVHFFSGKNGIKTAVLLHPADSVKLEKKETLRYNGDEYYKFTANEKDYFFFCRKDYCLLSDNKMLAEKMLRGLPSEFISDSLSVRMKEFVNSEASGHWFIFPKHHLNKQPDLFENPFLFKHLGEILIWDLENTGDLSYSGIVLNPGNNRSISEIFERTDTYEVYPESYLPDNTSGFVSLSFDSFELFYKSWIDFKTYAGYRNNPVNNALFKSLKSVTQSYGNESYLVTFFGSSPDKLTERFQLVTTHNNTDIYRTGKDSTLLTEMFRPLLKKRSYPYAMFYDNYLIWSPSIQAAKKLTKYIENNKVFSKTGTYKNLMSATAGNYHLASYNKNKFYTLTLTNGLLFIDFKTSAGSKINPNPDGKTSRTAWKKISSVKTSFDFHIPPKWIYNHRTGKYEIIFQDTQNRLILADAKGKIKWKKDIGSPVTGEIHQVDMFRNGKRQFVFSTGKGIYVIDILGNYVKPFPLKMNVGSPLAVFYYDNNRKYRLCFAEGNQVKIYDLNGKQIKGFSAVDLNAPLQFAPKHIRIKGKDYILLQQTDGTLRIVNRRGKDRVKVKGKVQVKTPWYNHQNKFTAVSSDGKKVHIDTKGNIVTDDKTSDISGAYFTAKHSIWISGKSVFVNGKKLDILPSEYVAPEIYYRHGKPLYIFIDKEAKEVVIYDGKTIERLPGDYQAEWLQKPGAQYLLTRFLPDEIIVYYRK
jgi:hypothetical protein